MKYINKLTNGLDSDNSIFKFQLKNLDNILHEKYDNSTKEIANLFRRADAIIHSQHSYLSSEQESSEESSNTVTSNGNLVKSWDQSGSPEERYVALYSQPTWELDSIHYYGKIKIHPCSEYADLKLHDFVGSSNSNYILEAYNCNYNSNTSFINLSSNQVVTNSNQVEYRYNLLYDIQGGDIEDIIIYAEPVLIDNIGK